MGTCHHPSWLLSLFAVTFPRMLRLASASPPLQSVTCLWGPLLLEHIAWEAQHSWQVQQPPEQHIGFIISVFKPVPHRFFWLLMRHSPGGSTCTPHLDTQNSSPSPGPAPPRTALLSSRCLLPHPHVYWWPKAGCNFSGAWLVLSSSQPQLAPVPTTSPSIWLQDRPPPPAPRVPAAPDLICILALLNFSTFSLTRTTSCLFTKWPLCSSYCEGCMWETP